MESWLMKIRRWEKTLLRQGSTSRRTLMGSSPVSGLMTFDIP